MLNQILIMILLFRPTSSNNIYQGTKIENQITFVLVDIEHSFFSNEVCWSKIMIWIKSNVNAEKKVFEFYSMGHSFAAK